MTKVDRSPGTASSHPGSGLVVYNDDVHTVSIRRFHIAGSSLCGVHFVVGALDLSEGLIEQNPIGVCVDVPDYDLGRLSNGVRLRDNGTPLESRELPVPEFTPVDGD